eukprot:6960326-Karenia_brevis.AAC.1
MEFIAGEFIEHLWEVGESSTFAGDVLSSIEHFCGTRRKMPGAWRLLSHWRKLEIPNRAVPLPELAMYAL